MSWPKFCDSHWNGNRATNSWVPSLCFKWLKRSIRIVIEFCLQHSDRSRDACAYLIALIFCRKPFWSDPFSTMPHSLAHYICHLPDTYSRRLNLSTEQNPYASSWVETENDCLQWTLTTLVYTRYFCPNMFIYQISSVPSVGFEIMRLINGLRWALKSVHKS